MNKVSIFSSSNLSVVVTLFTLSYVQNKNVQNKKDRKGVDAEQE